MKKILLLEICFLFLATTFQSDRLTGWVQQIIPRQDLPVRDLQFIDSLTGFIIQSRFTPDTSLISKTTDGGNSWISTQFNNVYLSAIKFVDSNTGYCAGRIIPNGIIEKTTNGGQNWFIISSIGYSDALEDISFVNKDTGWVCSSDLTSGGLWRTTNGGISWQKQLDETIDPTKLFFINANTGWLFSYHNANLYKTTNSGVNWSVQYAFNGGPTDVYFSTLDTGWIIKSIGSGHNALVRSINGGNSWDSINAPIISTQSRLFFIDNKRGWAGSWLNKIYITKDGFNWGYQYSPSFTSYNVSFVDSLTGWAGYSGLVHTIEGGGPITQTTNNNEQIANSYKLFQNFPNPFNPSTNIKYKIGLGENGKWKMENSFVSIRIYDIIGKEIVTLVNKRQDSGEYMIKFDGGKLPSGIYFYSLFVNNKIVATRKMNLIK